MSKVKSNANAAPDLPRFLTIDQTAARLGYSRQTVVMMIQEGTLPAVNIAPSGGKTRALYRVRADAVAIPRIAGPGRIRD